MAFLQGDSSRNARFLRGLKSHGFHVLGVYMSSNLSRDRNRAFIMAGLGSALLIAILLSPFASSDPDGLNRVSEDLKFDNKALAETPAQKLPFANFFDGYAVKGLPDGIATSVAGLVGTLATFGLAWGLGKLLVRGSGSSSTNPDTPSSDDPAQPLDR